MGRHVWKTMIHEMTDRQIRNGGRERELTVGVCVRRDDINISALHRRISPPFNNVLPSEVDATDEHN